MLPRSPTEGFWVGLFGLLIVLGCCCSPAMYAKAAIQKPGDPSSLGSDAVLNIAESNDGSLWITTLGGGLNRWNSSDRTAGQPVFHKYQKSDGLKNDTVTVTASNNDGVWNDQGASVKLHVEPPPWRKPWAYALYTVFIGGSLVSYRRGQNRKLNRAAKHRAKLEREVQTRTRELSLRNKQLKALNEKLLEASTTDSLTGLKNRRYLYDSIESRVALVERRYVGSQRPESASKTVDIAPSLFFMMIDLDGFKGINDTYGHLAGDQALLQVRDILKSTCRKSDTIVRWGGDEFMIIGENTSSRAAEQLAERIRYNLAERQYQLGGGHVGRLSGSIGFTMYPFSPLNAKALSWDQAVAVADHAAYTAKKNGRNAWVGVYGTRKSVWEEFTKTRIDLDVLASEGMIDIRSSLSAALKFFDNAKREEVQ